MRNLPTPPLSPRLSVGVRAASLLLLGGRGAAGMARGEGPLLASAGPGNDLARAAAAAAAVVAVGDPATAAALVVAGEGTEIWVAVSVAAPTRPAQEKAPAIDRAILGGVEDHAPVRNADQNDYEALAYNHVLIEAYHTSARALAASARRDLTPAHLFEEPTKYRGQVIHVAGRLRRLRRFDPPRLAAKEGVTALYEGWIFGDAYGSQPYCVVLSELPPGIQVGDQLEERVVLDGYFFKIYRYKAADGRWHDAPLLIGHTLTLEAPPAGAAEAPGPFSQALLLGLSVLAALIVLLVVGLTWWYRQGDRRVQARLGTARGTVPFDLGLPNEPGRKDDKSA